MVRSGNQFYTQHVSDALHPYMRHWNKQAKAHHQEARATLILSGHYLGFLPKHLVHNWSLDKDVRSLLSAEYGYSNTFTAVWRKKHANEVIINAFTQCLQESLKVDLSRNI